MRLLGKTNMKVNRVGFGGIPIQRITQEETNKVINELIDKILVHQQTKVNGKKYQQIDIYYSGVGIISVSANEYDFEKEFQNILKNNRKTA